MLYKPNRSARLDWAKVREIRRHWAEGWTQGRIAREFGMSLNQIGKIIRDEAWIETGTIPPEGAAFTQEGSVALVQKLLDEANAQKARDKELEDLKNG